MILDRTQIAQYFLVLVSAEADDSTQRDEQLDRVVTVFIATVPDLGKLVKYILEMIDPAYGIGRTLPQPCADEPKRFCGFLREGKYLESYGATSNAHALVEALAAGTITEELRAFSRADIDSLVALTQAAVAVFFHGIRIGAVSGTRPDFITPDAVITPFCTCVRRLLAAHQKESGHDAMQSILSYMTDRLVAILNEGATD